MKTPLCAAALVLFAIAPFAAHAAPCGVTTGKSASTLLLYFARTGDARNVRCLLDNGARFYAAVIQLGRRRCTCSCSEDRRAN